MEFRYKNVHKVVIFFLFTFFGLASVEASDICSSNNDPKRILSFYQKILYPLLSTANGIGVNETKFLTDNFWSGLATEMKETTYWAIVQSEAFCRPKPRQSNGHALDTEDNEVDAIRHFVVAALLHYFYPDKAMELLFAHEIKGGRALTASDLMDLSNNHLGGKFSQELRKQRANLSKSEVSLLALEKSIHLLKSGELKILKTTESGKCHRISEKSESELNQFIQEHSKSFDLTIKKCEENGIAFHACGRH